MPQSVDRAPRVGPATGEGGAGSLHICLLCNEYPPAPPGGIGTVTKVLGRALSARGHRVSVVGVYERGPWGEFEDAGVRVVRLPHSRVPGTGLVVHRARLGTALRRLHDADPIDVLEAPEIGLALTPASFAAAQVIRMHGGHHFFAHELGQRSGHWRTRMERRSFGRADALCAVSRYVADSTRELLDLGGREIEVLPNPVDTSVFRPQPEIVREDGLLLFVGTVCEKKGMRQLMLAVPHIVAAVPKARLWVVGRDQTAPGGSGSYTERARGLLPARLQDRVTFRGPVSHDELPALFARASACVLPSHMEAQGVVAVESMATGTPTLFSRTGPGPELIEDGRTGLLCDPFDPASVAEQAVRLLRNPELRSRLGAAGRRCVEERFSLDAMVARNEAFYRRCADSRGR